MRRTLDEHDSIGHDEASRTFGVLVRVYALNGFAFFLTTVDIVAVDECDLCQSLGDLVGTIAIAGCHAHTVVPHGREERLGLAVTPYGEQSRDMCSGGTEQRIGYDGLTTEAWLRVRANGVGFVLHPTVEDQHAGAGRKSSPVVVRIAKLRRDPFGAGG